jgi:hypothetical protein
MRINDRDEMMLMDIRRVHLRHPGMVSKRIANLAKQDTFTSAQLGQIRTEWLRLGLDQTKGPKHV